MTLLPKVKLKAAVNFPARVLDGTGIDIVKSNGSYQFNLDFGDFAPPVTVLPDAVHQHALVWNSITGSYLLAPVSVFSGAVIEAPLDGKVYGRLSGAWTDAWASPTLTGTPVAPTPTPGDNDTSIATTAFVTSAIAAIGAGAVPASATPIVESGVGAVGTSIKYAREDHIHPRDLTSDAFLQVGTGAVNRTMLSKAQDIINAADFGLLPSNTGAQNVTAWGVLMTFAASNPCTIHINRGTYDFNAQIAFNCSNVRLTGDGIDATILRCTFASGDFIVAYGTTWYQTIDNLTITSSVTRTADAMFFTVFWKRGLMYRVKISNHYTGINLPQFEQCTLAETSIVTPTGAGVAIVAGTPAATNQGANLNIVDCFFRGNDETNPVSTPIGHYGIIIYDVEAIFMVNTDFSAFVAGCGVVTPQTRAANCYFVQTFFDATVSGHNFTMQGTGVKLSMQFTGCWFGTAGGFGAGTANCHGLNLDAGGGYDDILVSGCRFITPAAAGICVATPYTAMNITGSTFINCGANAGSSDKHSIFVAPSSAALRTLNITGNYCTGAAGIDVVMNAAASGRVNISGNAFTRSIVWPDGALLGNASGNTDTISSPITFQLASASTINPSPAYNYVVISGTTNINRIQPTYPGHQLSLRFLAALTVADDVSNLRLAGNLVTTGNTVLTLVCEGNGDWREVARVAS